MLHGRAPQVLLGALCALTVVLVVRNASHGDGWPGWTAYLYNAIELGALAAVAWRTATLRCERGAWATMSAALACFVVGDLSWTVAFDRRSAIAYPSVSDALYVAFFPLAALAVVRLARARAGRVSTGQLLDALIAGLAATSLAVALLSSSLLDGSGGVPAAAIMLAYPIGAVALLALVAGLAAIFGPRRGRTWLLLGGALALACVADLIYATQAARGTYATGGLLDVGWPAAALLCAFAAWQRPLPAAARVRTGRALAVPLGAAVVTVGIVVFDHYAMLPAASVWLGAAALVALLARFALIHATHRHMLASSEREARTDALTGLPNRRALMEALSDVERDGRPVVVALYDLDGFKAYNDRFGHPAGDRLLRRLAGRLTAAAEAPGQAFRIGGDEFCVLTTPEQAEATLAAAERALRETGDDYAISGSHGWAAMPGQARTAAQALSLVDQRMYAAKRLGRASAAAQVRDVLLRVVAERGPAPGGHTGDAAELAARIAARLGMSPDEIEHVRAAAELRDVGKLAVPDAILGKAGPLDEAEWTVMHRHTVAGERILQAAPSLADVAPFVRSSHERWDGRGYPDGLAGEQIPLGARIVALCDAWEAMTTDHPYRAARCSGEALEEIRRCSGAQFDPRVVAAFHDVIADLSRTPARLA